MVCKAKVHTKDNYKIRNGANERHFTFRYNNHTMSFWNMLYEYKTELSKCLWQLNEVGTIFRLKWSTVTHASPYRCGTRRCDLYLTEEYIILQGLNKSVFQINEQILYLRVAIKIISFWKLSSTEITESFSFLTHSFPMHSFSTPWKHAFMG